MVHSTIGSAGTTCWLGSRCPQRGTIPDDPAVLLRESVPLRPPSLLVMKAMSEVTRVLSAIEQGDPHAAGQLLPLVYDELRRLAAAKMAREAPGQTLQPTALVHEVWLRLGGDQQPNWANRGHFFAAAAEGMRRILIENARRKRAIRHGGEFAKISADSTGFDLASPPEVGEDLLLVSDALDAFAAHDARKAELVKLKYFVGLTLEEAADVLGTSHRTAKRDWAYARAWLFNEVNRL